MNWNNKTVLITGGGSGIGREIAKQLYEKGATLIVASLVELELDSLHQELSSKKDRLITITIDLTKANAIDELLEKIKENKVQIDVLINNAGTALYGEHISLDTTRINTMLTLNILVLTELCTKVAHQMIANNIKGQILNIASIGAFTPMPNLAAYTASKSYVLSFSHALKEELAPKGIFVGTYCPGITKTPIFQAMGLELDNKNKNSISYISQKFAMSVESTAKLAIESIEKKHVVSLPKLNKVMPIYGILPNRLKAWIAQQTVKSRAAK